tara:strand:- start:186 stop:386 length:201 start_codon:yes stop_codon:yes gene_type:complete
MLVMVGAKVANLLVLLVVVAALEVIQEMVVMLELTTNLDLQELVVQEGLAEWQLVLLAVSVAVEVE